MKNALIYNNANCKLQGFLALGRVRTKYGVGHGVGHGIGHGVGVVNFPKKKKNGNSIIFNNIYATDYFRLLCPCCE